MRPPTQCAGRPFITRIGPIPLVLLLAACSDGITPTEIGPGGVSLAVVHAAPSCGQTITVSTVLTADVLACPDYGLIINADSITLDGAGHTIEYGAAGNDNRAGVLLVGRSGVTVKNLELVDVNPAGARVRGIWLQNTASNNQLLDNTIRTNGVSENDGIAFGPGNVFQSNTVRGNDITTNGTSLANNGIFFAGGDANLIDANVIRTHGTHNNFGIQVQSSAAIAARKNIIQYNDIVSGGTVATNDGIRVSGDATDSTMVVGNTITTNGTANTAGITLITSTHHNEIRGNTIVTNGPGVNHHGIQVILFASDNLVLNNTISTSGLSSRGVSVGNASGNEFSGNVITTGTDGGNGEGFLLDNSSNDNLIADNEITTVANAGIHVRGSTGAKITGNTIHTTNSSPIALTAGSNAAEISGNTLRWTGPSQIGLVLSDGSAPVKLFHNNFGADDGLPSNPASKVDSDTPIELSFNGEGNFWGRSCPGPDGPLFEPFVHSVDSNSPTVVDSFAFGAFDGWLTGASPGCLGEAIAGLIDTVLTFELQRGLETALRAQLEGAANSLANDRPAAVSQLGAFINLVEAQRGNKLTDAEAEELIAAAQSVIDVVNALP